MNKNIKLWYLVTFLSSAAFAMPIWVIFSTEFLQLNYTQAYLIGVLPYGLSAFFEIPTGSWADRFGRARTYQVGNFLYALSMGSYLVFTSFYPLLIMQVIGAIGISMQSGSLEPLIRDSIDKKYRDKNYQKIFSYKNAILYFSRVVTSLVGGFLYMIDPRMPIAAVFVFVVAALLCSMFISEVREQTVSSLSSVKHIKTTFEAMKKSRHLVAIIIVVISFTFVSEGLYAFYQPYFHSLGVNIADFGIFYAFIAGLSIIGSIWMGKLSGSNSQLKILIYMMVGMIFTLICFLTQSIPIAYLATIPSSFIFGVSRVIRTTSVQKYVDSKYQSTALSIESMTTTTSFFLVFLLVGVLLDYLTIPQVNVSLLLIGIVLVVQAIFVSRSYARRKLED